MSVAINLAIEDVIAEFNAFSPLAAKENLVCNTII